MTAWPAWDRAPTLPRAFFVGSEAYDEWCAKEGSEPNPDFIKRMKQLLKESNEMTPTGPLKTAAPSVASAANMAAADRFENSPSTDAPMWQSPNPRQPGLAQQANTTVSYHPTIHHDPFATPKMHSFMVGDIECGFVVRNWRDKPSYDPHSLDMPHGVRLDEAEPGWETVRYDTLRELIFAHPDGVQYTSVRFRLDW